MSSVVEYNCNYCNTIMQQMGTRLDFPQVVQKFSFLCFRYGELAEAGFLIAGGYFLDALPFVIGQGRD